MEAGNGQIHRSDEREEMKLIIDTDPGIGAQTLLSFLAIYRTLVQIQIVLGGCSLPWLA